MGIEITAVEVFERAMVLPVDERAKLAKQLLNSLDSTVADAERSSAEQISERFKALDARFVVAARRELEQHRDDSDDDEPFGARLA